MIITWTRLFQNVTKGGSVLKMFMFVPSSPSILVQTSHVDMLTCSPQSNEYNASIIMWFWHQEKKFQLSESSWRCLFVTKLHTKRKFSKLFGWKIKVFCLNSELFLWHFGMNRRFLKALIPTLRPHKVKVSVRRSI